MSDLSVALSAESRVDLLYYTDNFTLTFLNQVEQIVPDVENKVFELYYNNDIITTGLIISKTTTDLKTEEVELEFGTINYLYTQETFDIGSGRKDITGLLEEWSNSIYNNSDILNGTGLKIKVNDDNITSDFGPYRSYKLESAGPEDNIKNTIELPEKPSIKTTTEDGNIESHKATDLIYEFTGFFTELTTGDFSLGNAEIWPSSGNIATYDDAGKLYFGKCGVYEANVTVGERSVAYGWAFIGIFYPYDESISGNIDFTNPKKVKIENPAKTATQLQASVREAPQTTYIFAKSGISEIKSNKGYEGLDILVYKLEGNILGNGSRSISWGQAGNTKEIREKYESTIDIIRSEIKQLYFSDEKISNENYNISISINSMYYERETVFIVASVGYTDERESTDEKVSIEKNVLVAMDMSIDDVFNYYFEDAQGKELLGELATVSDKVIFFRGKEIIVSDRDGLGDLDIDGKYIIDNKETIEYITYDRNKVDNIGTKGGQENGIVIMQGKEPFNIKEQIQEYYRKQLSGKRKRTEQKILEKGLPENFVLGKKYNGMVHKQVFNDNETVEIEAEDRV